jgi:hypothetical protein
MRKKEYYLLHRLRHSYVVGLANANKFQRESHARLQHINKFVDDTTVVGLITDGDETAYREEDRDLAVWCQDNNFSLDVIKTKELMVDYRSNRGVRRYRQGCSGVGRELQVSWRPHQ